MRIFVAAALLAIGISGSSLAQGEKQESIVTSEQRKAVSDERAAEIRAMIQAAQKRQARIDEGYAALMARWSVAVCVGCSPSSKRSRVVHTNPLRVLAGISTLVDDARERHAHWSS